MRRLRLAGAIVTLAMCAFLTGGVTLSAQQPDVPAQVLVGHTDWVLATPSVEPSPQALEAIQTALGQAIERYGPPPVSPVYLAFQTPDSTIVDGISVCLPEAATGSCLPGMTFYVFPATRADGHARLDQTDRFLRW